MKSLHPNTPSRETLDPCQPVPTRQWLRWYAIYSFLMLAAIALVNTAVSALFHCGPLIDWGNGVIQSLLVPLFILGFAAQRNRRSYRRRPMLPVNSEGAIQIRSNSTGKTLLVVSGGTLEHAELAGADLQDASLWGACLSGADLSGANLEGACLRGAVLDGANLTRAKLQHASMMGATLRNADLRGADLREAFVSGADLTGAIYDRRTRWLRPFDLAKAGAVYEEGGEADLPIPHDGDVVSEAKLPIPAESRPQTTEAASEVAGIGVRT